jgi:hypothetical protein
MSEGCGGSCCPIHLTPSVRFETDEPPRIGTGPGRSEGHCDRGGHRAGCLPASVRGPARQCPRDPRAPAPLRTPPNSRTMSVALSRKDRLLLAVLTVLWG